MAELIVALDVPSRKEALALVDRLGPGAPLYKVGLELFARAGPEIVRELRERRRGVFLDLKFHDIPNTVAAAAEAAADLGVDLLTIHASGGPRMIEAARAAVGGTATQILGVSVLTSLSDEELVRIRGGEGASVRDQVVRLAELAMDHGAHGVVASPREVPLLRERLGPGALLVTPGIRIAGSELHDQARVATPGEAVRAGADFLVVGRPISRAKDPAEALAAVRAGMVMEMEEV